MAGKNIPVLLVTANVGSIFEDPSVMLKIWTEEFLQTVARLDPKFIAVHCQEVGGKNYERSMKHVEFFVRLLMSSEELRLFDKVRIYLDEDFSSAENFTALGNFYFIHESLTDVLLWDFAAMSFVPAAGKEVHSGNIEAVTTKEKAKFPQDFFPSCKWSRKGFLRTRWSLDGTVFDLINIHLFHDASNFVAMEMNPSVYCTNRRRALEHTLDRFHTDAFGTAPFFVFGDFNFRTDTKGVVSKLSEGLNETRLQSQKTDVSKMQYQDESSQVVLSLGKKEFSHRDHQSVFQGEEGKWLKAFDCELDSFAGRLFEFPIVFGPSYPFEENENGAKNYMKTRCPSWCDRVILSNTATSLVNNFSDASGVEYNVMGANTCMGDHKPVYLSLRLQSGAGTVACCPPLRGSTACLNGLSRFPPLDTLTLPRGPRVHDEPYTPESMDTPSPLPSPIPSEPNQSQKTFNDSVAARLRSVGDDSLPGYRAKRGAESPFNFACSDINEELRRAEREHFSDWMVDSPRVLVTEYPQMSSITTSELGDGCFVNAEEATSFNALVESRCSNSASTPILNTAKFDSGTSQVDRVAVRDDSERSVFDSRSLLTESDLCLAKLAGERPNNRVQSQSVSEFTVSEYDKGEPLRADRCFSDASWLRQNRRVRLISENESITRLQSHHSSSDEDWFEDAESDAAVINATVSQHVPKDKVNDMQNVTSASNAFNNNVDVTKELNIICPPQEIHSSLLNGIGDGMSINIKVKKPDYDDSLSGQESIEFLKSYKTSSVAVEVGSSTEHNLTLKASRNSLSDRGKRREPRKSGRKCLSCIIL